MKHLTTNIQKNQIDIHTKIILENGKVHSIERFRYFDDNSTVWKIKGTSIVDGKPKLLDFTTENRATVKQMLASRGYKVERVNGLMEMLATFPNREVIEKQMMEGDLNNFGYSRN